MHILLALLAVLAPVSGFSPDEVEAAMHGQVPVHVEPYARPDGKMAGKGYGAIVVERTPGQVWATLSRFEDKAEYMPRLKTLAILEKSPEKLRVHMVVDASVTTARYTLWFRLEEAERRISWTLDHTAAENTIKEAQGEYRLYEVAPERTLITYTSAVDTGRALPRFIQDYMSRRSIPDLLRAIKKRVESDGRYHK